MYFYAYFQTDILVNLFIPLWRRAKAITWQNFVPAKQHSGRTKEGSRLAGMKLFTRNQSQDVIYEEFITLPGSRQNGTEFHSCQPGSCNHHLKNYEM